MKRQVGYTWRLSELMASRGLHNNTDLIPLLAERGSILSRPQVYRIVNQPERGPCRSSQRSATSSPADPKTSSPSPPPMSEPARPEPPTPPTPGTSIGRASFLLAGVCH
ncbi:hypothetical protein ABIB17_003745 [Arthrobacter sp. UYEF6]